MSIKATHFAVQLDTETWLVTFVSELGITETRLLNAFDFIAMIASEAGRELDDVANRMCSRDWNN